MLAQAAALALAQAAGSGGSQGTCLHVYLVAEQAQRLEGSIQLLLPAAACRRLPEGSADELAQVGGGQAAASDALRKQRAAVHMSCMLPDCLQGWPAGEATSSAGEATSPIAYLRCTPPQAGAGPTHLGCPGHQGLEGVEAELVPRRRPGVAAALEQPRLCGEQGGQPR